MVENRDKKTGRFLKGYTYRAPKPYWDKDWLYKEYVERGKSASEIAKEQGCKTNNILYFLKKFKIKTRSISEARKIKKWGLRGKKNPMYGRYGVLNPNWQGGKSPLRQKLYSKSEWKTMIRKILARDGYRCQICGAEHKDGRKLVIHHLLPVSCFPEFIDKEWNLVTLCDKCHKKIHKAKFFRVNTPEDFDRLVSTGGLR